MLTRNKSEYRKPASRQTDHSISRHHRRRSLTIEPLETRWLLTSIAVPSVTNGTFDESNIADVYTFEAQRGAVYQIGLDGPARVRLENADGLRSSVFRDGTFNWFAPENATYALDVRNDATSLDDYMLSIEEVVYADDHANVLDDATSLAVPASVTGELEVEGDADYFSFEATASAVYRVAAEGMEIEICSPVRCDKTVDSRRIVAETSNTYYFGVTRSDYVGSYSLNIEEVEDDHGNVLSAATPINHNQPMHGRTETSGDIDVFSFEAVGGRGYRVATSNASEGATEIYLLIYDATGNLLASDVDGSGGRLNEAPRDLDIEWIAPEDGTYFSVFQRSGESYGDYSIVVASIDSPTHVAVPTDTDGQFESDIDADAYSFNAAAGTWYEIFTRKLADTGLRLTDTDGATVLADTDIQSAQAYIRWLAP